MGIFSLRNIVYKNLEVFRRTMSSSKRISIKVKPGTVVGVQSILPNGQPYYAFKGIPYAVPPVGDLRFKAPVPLARFQEEQIDCSVERDVSFQKHAFTGDIVGSEDCLYLNVYTPKLKSEKPLPVMVWVHGGAFLFGSGNSDFNLPLYLIQEDVVVVTLNYRLGILGFLHLPDGGIQGNAGLRDQLEVLKWVKDNISYFNGDTENVTLFGQSAGAASVHLHAMSSESKKYFHKAILQSGNAVNEWLFQRDPLYKARKLAELAGCTAKTDKEIADFLRNKEPVMLFQHLLNVLTPEERRRDLPMPFKPVIEGNTSDAVVSRHPCDVIKEFGSFEIPFMMGYTSKEGITMLPTVLKKLDEHEKDLARLIPRSLNLESDDPNCLKVADEMRRFYVKGDRLSKKYMNELTDLLSDYHFVIGSHIVAEMHSRRQHKSPLFFYRFSFDGELNYLKTFFNLREIKGACHGDDLFYMLQMSSKDEHFTPGSREEKIVTSMCRMWANFAKYSNPTPPEDETLNVKWDPVKKIGEKEEFVLDYLEIDDNIRMEKNPDKDRMDFWRRIFKTWNEGFLKPKL